MSANDRNEQVEKLRQLAQERGLIEPTASELSEALNNPQRKKIKLPGDNRELGEFAREIGEIVSDVHLYRRDRTPVIINSEKKRLDVMTAEMLRTWVERHLVCFREKKISVGEGATTLQFYRTMNLDTARGTLESPQFQGQLHEIDRVNETRLPVIRADGQLDLLSPGYFAERSIYTFDDGMRLDEGLSLAQAREIIDDLLQYFPFPNERSRAVMIAGMLTMFCATMLPRYALRPGFIFTANSPGAGKTLGAKICIIPVAGSASTRTFPRYEEAKKVLDIIAMEASNYVLFDNIRGKIAGEEIEAFITSPVWEGRVLGESTKFRVDNVATVFLTGNQSTTSADMADRCLFVELFVQEADNRDRKIPTVIDDSYLGEPANRARILSALWAFVRVWDAEGRRPGPSVMPRFEAWSRLIGGIVLAAGYADPVAKAELIGLGDLELKDMRELLAMLAPDSDAPEEADRSRVSWRFSEVIEKVTEAGLFEDVEVRQGKSVEQMFTVDGITPAGKSHFGKMLSRYDKRVFGTGDRMLRFMVEGKGNSRRYTIVDESAVADAVPPA